MRRLILLVALALASGATAQPLTSIYSVRSPNSQGGGFFGTEIAALGDLDGDGVRDFAVGALNEVSNTGRVHVYSGATGGVIRTIQTPNGQTGTFFGASVADAGDVDGDGTSDILTSAYSTVGGDAWAGQAFVFSGASGALLLTLESPASQENGFFGFNVAGPGDLDGDGTPDLVVGAGDEDVVVSGSTVVDHGAVYAFSGDDGSLLWRSTPATQEASIFYGRVVSAADFTGDGVTDLLAGAVLADNTSGIESGLAYVVNGATGAISFTLQPGSNAQGNGFFGHTLTVLDDLDGGGTPEIAVGAPYEGVGGTSVRDGTVSFYRGENGSLIGTYVLEERQAERGFGWEVQNLGDLDGDGIGEIGISAVRQFNRFQHRPPPYSLPFSGAVFVASGADIGDANVIEIAEVVPVLPEFPTTFNWRYGEDFAALGDMNGDGLPDVAIGAPTQGANIGFVGVISGARILAMSDVDVEAEATQTVAASGTYDFGETAVDLMLDGVSTSRPASGDIASGGGERLGNGGGAPEAAGGASDVFIMRRGVSLASQWSAKGDGGNLRVQRFDSAPINIDGITEANVSAYRWTLQTEGPLRWTAAGSEIRFALGQIPSSGIQDPTDVTVYLRESIGDGEFSALTTTYDGTAGEIVATGFASSGSFTGEFALASDSNPLPTESGPAPGLALRASPNPARGGAAVALVLAAPEAVRVAVVDALGREVAVLHAGPLAAGETAWPLDASTLRAGVYVVRAVAASGTASTRLTLVR